MDFSRIRWDAVLAVGSIMDVIEIFTGADGTAPLIWALLQADRRDLGSKVSVNVFPGEQALTPAAGPDTLVEIAWLVRSRLLVVGHAAAIYSCTC